ncbi:hypothetical protein [Klebsiella variicola]|uniref:hypothetical protein n=1 Tax=Klebsiella variicola TaxID=244366 RepID=UPI003AAD141B
MKTIRLSISEWLGVVTIASAIYSYVYYYRFWDFFGINAYDYFGYIDALQHSIPSIISALGVFQSFSLIFVCVLLFAKKRAVFFYRFSLYISRTSYYKRTLKLSVFLFVLIFLSSYFLKWFLRSGLFSLDVSYVMVATLSSILVSTSSTSFSFYFMLNGIKGGDGIKKSLSTFFLCQVSLQVLFSSFYLPIINAFHFKIHDNAQAIFKDDEVVKTQRLLGITKDYYIVMDGGRGVVRKIDTLQYVIYNEK